MNFWRSISIETQVRPIKALAKTNLLPHGIHKTVWLETISLYTNLKDAHFKGEAKNAGF